MELRGERLTRAGVVLRRLQRSPKVADTIPWELHALDLVVVVLISPIALLCGLLLALAVMIDSPGPPIYRSRRIGRGGREFDMLKFRTMRHGAGGPSLSAKGDERYTHLGRSLSASRLDELPQLWNVAKGDMRLVGPRPEIREFVEAFPREYETILSVPPGLTGPAQLDFAFEGRVLASVEDRGEYYRTELLPLKVAIDLDYAQRHGARRDLRILLLTPWLPFYQLALAIGSALTAARHDTTRAHIGLRALPGVMLVIGTLALTALLIAETTSPI